MKLLDLIVKNLIPIYVISLVDQTDRRNSVTNLFKQINLEFNFVNAVRGSKLDAGFFYNRNNNFYRRQLTPGEMGCSISHQVAYNELLKSPHEYMIILEDDVILNDLKFFEVEFDLDANKDCLIFLGGQEGLRRGRLLSCVRNSKVQFFKNIIFAYFFQRTCAYIISKRRAKDLINLWERKTFLADDWYYILSNSNFKSVGYIPIFKHPTDLTDSLIEKERLSIN